MHVVYKHGVYHCIYTVLIVDTQLYSKDLSRTELINKWTFSLYSQIENVCVI